MPRLTLLLAITAALSLTACRSPDTHSSTTTTPAPSPAATRPSPTELPEPPPLTRATPSDADAKAVEPAATELARRADAGDTAYIARLMDGARQDAAADMIARIKKADVRNTFRSHLAVRGADAAGLNYHDPSHFQVDLKKGANGEWAVSRLWLCR
jgi:cell division septation protein DedD